MFNIFRKISNPGLNLYARRGIKTAGGAVINPIPAKEVINPDDNKGLWKSWAMTKEVAEFSEDWLQNWMQAQMQMHGKIGHGKKLKQAAQLSLRFAEHHLITHKPSSLKKVMNMNSKDDTLSGASELMISVTELAEFHMDKFLVDIRKEKVDGISQLYQKHQKSQLNSKGLFQGKDALFAEYIRRFRTSIEDGQGKDLIQILKEEEDDSMMYVMNLCLEFGWYDEAKCLLKGMKLLGIDSARYWNLFRKKTVSGYENKLKVTCGKPLKGWAQLNTDGSFQESKSVERKVTEENNSWVGGVLRNDTLDLMAEYTTPLNLQDSYGSEILGVTHGVEIALEQEVKCLLILTDHENLVKKLSSPTLPKKARKKFSKIKNLLDSLEAYEVRHVLREGNEAANYMASELNKQITSRMLPEERPPQYSKILRDDGVGKIHYRK